MTDDYPPFHLDQGGSEPPVDDVPLRSRRRRCPRTHPAGAGHRSAPTTESSMGLLPVGQCDGTLHCPQTLPATPPGSNTPPLEIATRGVVGARALGCAIQALISRVELGVHDGADEGFAMCRGRVISRGLRRSRAHDISPQVRCASCCCQWRRPGEHGRVGKHSGSACVSAQPRTRRSL